MTHIDEWLDQPGTTDGGEAYARKFFEQARRPAINKDHKWLAAHPLFCTHNDVRYRCTGASRLGDVWLTTIFEQVAGYQLRVDVDKCSNWSPEETVDE